MAKVLASLTRRGDRTAPFLWLKQIQTVSVIAVVLTLLISCAQPSDNLHQFSGPTMGTTYQVKFIYNPQTVSEFELKKIESAVSESLVSINQLMSTYIPDSELSRLNATSANESFQISNETAMVIREAIRLYEVSKGYLDITVGPLVNLWGFGPEARPDKRPTVEQITEVRDYVGIDKFILDGRTITKMHQDVYIDLSTIAKGYAVDVIAELLEKSNIQNYLVDIGGEMRVSGQKPAGKDWLLAIEKPISTEHAVQQAIVIGNNAIATSGDYRNFFEQDGVRYSHLIDPTTGQPIQHNLVAVSVIDKSAMTADGLATALIVMGKERGLDIANQYDVPALFITKEGDDFVEYQSDTYSEIVRVLQ